MTLLEFKIVADGNHILFCKEDFSLSFLSFVSGKNGEYNNI
jgi:hypothetical protein